LHSLQSLPICLARGDSSKGWLLATKENEQKSINCACVWPMEKSTKQKPAESSSYWVFDKMRLLRVDVFFLNPFIEYLRKKYTVLE